MKKSIGFILCFCMIITTISSISYAKNKPFSDELIIENDEEYTMLITDVKTKKTEILEHSSQIDNLMNVTTLDDNCVISEGYIPENLKNENQQVSTCVIIDGTDGRTPVSDYSKTRFPYTAIGYVESHFDAGIAHGTGVMIGDNIVLTAGHCIYVEAYGGYANEIFFTPGKYAENGIGSSPFGTSSAEYFVTVDEYMAQDEDTVTAIESAQVDWGMLILYEDLGEQSGYMTMKNYKILEDVNNLAIMLTGYPVYINGLRQYNQWQMAGNIRNAYDRYLTYKIDTTDGQSGSPICDSDNYVIGVHNTERKFYYMEFWS